MARNSKSIPISLTPEMVAAIDRRSEELGISRSAYIQALIRQDLGEPGLHISPVVEDRAGTYIVRRKDLPADES